MSNYMNVLMSSPIFLGISMSDAEAMLSCIGYTTRTYKKGSTIYRVGDQINSLCIVLKGVVHIVKEDYWGNQSILTEITEGQLFGEAYACLNGNPIQVNVITLKDTIVAMLDFNSIMHKCPKDCVFHSLLVINLLKILANKNILLTNKLEAMSQRNIRNKVMTYLSQQSEKNNSNKFTIPFNRQQLADFLSVDRSALSKEICRLRDEGILEFSKNQFLLK